MESYKYPRTYHFPFSEGLTTDDRKVDSDWWKYFEGRELVLTEKLDGQCNCIRNNGVFARSHTSPTIHPWDKYFTESGGIFDNVNYLLSDEEAIYGESLYAIHSIEYQKLPSYFFMFAARNETDWYSWRDVCELADMCGLPTVPVLERNIFESPDELEEHILNHMKNGSVYGDTIEGVVVRVADDFPVDEFSHNVIKYVRKNHVQTDIHWTKNWKKANIII